VDYLTDKKEKYRAFIAGETIEVYLARMALSKTWGDELTIMAAALVYNMDFIILETKFESEVTHYSHSSVAAPTRTGRLGHLGEFHYVLVVANTIPDTEITNLTRHLASLHIRPPVTPNIKNMGPTFRRVATEQLNSVGNEIFFKDLLAEMGVIQIDKSKRAVFFLQTLHAITEGYSNALRLLFGVGNLEIL
jgi:hypothetical protein